MFLNVIISYHNYITSESLKLQYISTIHFLAKRGEIIKNLDPHCTLHFSSSTIKACSSKHHQKSHLHFHFHRHHWYQFGLWTLLMLETHFLFCISCTYDWFLSLSWADNWVLYLEKTWVQLKQEIYVRGGVGFWSKGSLASCFPWFVFSKKKKQ